MGIVSCRYQTGEVALPDYALLFVPTPPTVVLDSTNARNLPAQFYATISSQGSDTVARYGFVFSASKPVPTVSDSIVVISGKPAQLPFSFRLTTAQLKRATRYYLRAFAENAQGIAYNKDVIQFVVPDNRTIPAVALIAIENIASTSANAKSTITTDGNTPITGYGICFSATNAIPGLSDNVLVSGTSLSGVLPFNYAQVLNSLTDNTTYFVRSFATNAVGTAYSNVRSFKTGVVVASAPTVQTDNIVNIAATSATVDGTLINRGTAAITRYGVCYSTTNSAPTTADLVTVAGTTDPASLPLSFSINLTSLTQNTSYYVRTFATNSVGTSYGVARSFTTVAAVSTPPTVQTNEIVSTSITTSSATASGTITTGGTVPLVQYGFCYSTTNPNPTIADALLTVGSASPGTYPFNYTGNLTGLAAATVYNVRAFARSSAGTSYGPTKTFRTVASATAPPAVQTVNTTNISYTTAGVLGNVTSGGTAPITEYGIVYSAINSNPTTADSKLVVGTGQPGSFPQAFTGNLNGLTPNTTYTVRAYATNAVGTSYGNAQRLSTLVATPGIITDRVTYTESSSSVDVSGTIQTAGATAITRYGFCYSATNATPTIADNPTDVGTSVTRFPFTFSRSFLRLAAGTYYFRTYAANANGVAYGSSVSVQVYTSPTVSTDRSVVKDPAAGIETLFGNITSGGTNTITEYGFCYAPTASAGRGFQVGDRNVSVIRKTTPVPVRFPFAYSLDATVPYNTDYSYRAYVRTSTGYVYGNISTFYISYKP